MRTLPMRLALQEYTPGMAERTVTNRANGILTRESRASLLGRTEKLIGRLCRLWQARPDVCETLERALEQAREGRVGKEGGRYIRHTQRDHKPARPAGQESSIREEGEDKEEEYRAKEV